VHNWVLNPRPHTDLPQTERLLVVGVLALAHPRWVEDSLPLLSNLPHKNRKALPLPLLAVEALPLLLLAVADLAHQESMFPLALQALTLKPKPVPPNPARLLFPLVVSRGLVEALSPLVLEAEVPLPLLVVLAAAHLRLSTNPQVSAQEDLSLVLHSQRLVALVALVPSRDLVVPPLLATLPV